MKQFSLYFRAFKDIFKGNQKVYLLQLVKAISEKSGAFINILLAYSW